MAFCALGTLAIGPAMAAAPVPPPPGTASNFSQGSNPRVAAAARKLGVARYRDSIRWAEVERTRGSYRFDAPTTTWPDRLPGGARVTLTLNWGNPLYDDGKTPHSAEALAAFGRFAAAVVKRFPAIDTLEIGNEVNGANFVSGPVKAAGLSERARYHLAMVRAAADAVRAARPDVRVLGGATHSLPAGYLWPLLRLDGANAIEGLAVHPYTTPIDQLPAQIGVLRRSPAASRLPLHVTEFGSSDPSRAADDLLRGYATLAALGAAEFDWYPLSERGDGLVPLISSSGSLTAPGAAFRLVTASLASLPVRDVSPDPFTRAYRFGGSTEVLWGAPRAVSVSAGVAVRDAGGARLDARGRSLREDRALVITADRPLAEADISLGCNALVADSFYQFGYPADGAPQSAGDAFDRFVRDGSDIRRFETMPGQQRKGVPWNPYLGLASMPNLRLSADSMVPATPSIAGAIVHRFTADRQQRIRLLAEFDVSADSRDGISVALTQEGKPLIERSGKQPIRIDLQLSLRRGDNLDIAVGPNADRRGDSTQYRIRVFDEDRCR